MCILGSTNNIMITLISLASEKIGSLSLVHLVKIGSPNAGVFSVVLYSFVRDSVDVSGVKQEQTSRHTERKQSILDTNQYKTPFLVTWIEEILLRDKPGYINIPT